MCQDLGDPFNGNISFKLDMTSTFDVMTIATYHCHIGYFLTGGDQVRVCMGTRNSTMGNWNGTKPYCECKVYIS